MDRFGFSSAHRPVTYWQGRAVYATHLVIAIFVLTIIVTTILSAMHASSAWALLPFDSSRVLHGEAWRLFTYGLINPPSLGFAIDMLMLLWFGLEVEKFFGHRSFLLFFAALYVVPPIVLTVLGLWYPSGLVGELGSFGVFVAFATLYPNAVLLFNLLAKWVAGVFVAIYALIHLSDRDWPGLITLLTTCLLGYAYVRHQQGRIALPSLRWPRRGPKLRVLPDLPASHAAAPTSEAAEIDALLDKIAQSGLSSLTAKERAKLERRRDNLRRPQ